MGIADPRVGRGRPGYDRKLGDAGVERRWPPRDTHGKLGAERRMASQDRASGWRKSPDRIYNMARTHPHKILLWSRAQHHGKLEQAFVVSSLAQNGLPFHSIFF